MRDYEKEDIVRRAGQVETEWKNPFPEVDDWTLRQAQKNLREIQRDIRNARMAIRWAEETRENDRRRAESYLDD